MGDHQQWIQPCFLDSTTLLLGPALQWNKFGHDSTANIWHPPSSKTKLLHFFCTCKCFDVWDIYVMSVIFLFFPTCDPHEPRLNWACITTNQRIFHLCHVPLYIKTVQFTQWFPLLQLPNFRPKTKWYIQNKSCRKTCILFFKGVGQKIKAITVHNF